VIGDGAGRGMLEEVAEVGGSIHIKLHVPFSLSLSFLLFSFLLFSYFIFQKYIRHEQGGFPQEDVL
jgi:hypothetical protein